MMRIRPISSSVTLAMMAIVLAAPLAVNFVLSASHKTPASIAAPGTTQPQHPAQASVTPSATDYFR
ncbi:MAG: hypothetical protein Q8R02_00710 [Hyphomonadaceae bacterium]|nr:hypothetical protein [Hyphomonadaceae bacterium]